MGLCTKWSLYEIKCKILGTTSYKKSLFEVTPMLLYEMVTLVRSGYCSKWSLYEVTCTCALYFAILLSKTLRRKGQVELNLSVLYTQTWDIGVDLKDLEDTLCIVSQWLDTTPKSLMACFSLCVSVVKKASMR